MVRLLSNSIKINVNCVIRSALYAIVYLLLNNTDSAYTSRALSSNKLTTNSFNEAVANV